MCKDVKDCPHYLESWWIEEGKEKPKLLRDCTTKRLLLQQQHMQLRLEQMQASLDTARTEYLLLAVQLKNMLDMTKSILIEHSKILKIEKKNDEINFSSCIDASDIVHTL